MPRKQKKYHYIYKTTCKMKKTSDEEKEEEGQEPVEETEAKKAPVKVKKGEKELEAEESAEMKMLKAIHETLKELVSSDKKVHATVEKGEPPEESPADKEEEKEKRGNAKEEESRAKREEKKDESVHKASMEQDFQKALTDAVVPLQAQINALTEQVQKLGDEPLFKSGLMITKIKEDGTPELGNAGALAAQRKKSQGKV